ncbi:BTAD domain-containing putative transcriptional regulator [Streptomyces sp. NPDC050856]|uniref:AfsR/SARP family transcriptional regulator n=1 Tax=Streptomyces sp. NPDC050856 TaxID=3154939 RepID=UPI0033C9C393
MTYGYRVLGDTRVLRPDGTLVPLAGPRLRALLTALAAAGGRAVPAGDLAAQVWPPGAAGGRAGAPADGPAALQALVGRLRRALGREAVVSVPGGYRLAARREDIDLFRFERLAADGVAALGGGDPRGAARLLDQALALWQGPVLADLPDRDEDPLVVRTERRHTGARRARLAAEVALGRPERALDGLAELTAERPLDEPAAALRIRALRAAGRPAEALAAYGEVRARLADLLGTEPGPELRSLHAELLAGAPGDAVGADAGRPARGTGGALARVPGDGRGFGAAAATGQPHGAGHGRPDPAHDAANRAAHTTAPHHPRAATAVPAGHPSTAPGSLRARLTSFVGRDAELARLVAELGRRRLVTLLGPGGVGKTRLALEAADTAGGAWPDGVRVAELAPVRDEDGVPGAVLTALGAREPLRWTAGAPARDPLGVLVEHCARRRLLLVLDNCEHVAGAAAALAETVLTACPGITVLATGREPLGVPGETVHPVEPLGHDAALRLLAERGAMVRPGFEVSGDPDACAEICRRLDGLPLGIELAAARLRALSPRRIADRLDDRFRLLTGGSRTALPRQRTLRAVVDWSWELLDDTERAVLRRLSVFSGGWALPQAEAVCAEPDTVERLASLVDKSLVVTVPAPAGDLRYRLLETVADYAAERLAEAGEREATARRHLAAYRELARTGESELRGPRQSHRLTEFETEHDNIRAALRTAVELGEEPQALCLALSMNWFWQLRGHQADARAWSVAAAGLGPDPFLPPVRRAVPMTGRCTDTPPPWPEETLWEARRGVRLMALAADGDQEAAPAGPGNRGRLEAVADAYRPGLPQNCRQPGAMWFFVRLMLGEFGGLDDTMDACVASAREHGDDGELGLALLMRARLRHAAARDAGEALERFEAAGDPWGVAEALSARGEAYEREGRHADAAHDYERAVAAAGQTGARTQAAVFQARLAHVRLRTATGPAERERAERLLREAAEDAAEHGVEAVSTARLLLAQHYGDTGRTALARRQLDTVEEELAAGTPGILTGLVLGLRGWLDCLDGDHAAARSRVAAALRRLSPLAYLVAPHLILSQFPVAAWAMGRAGGGLDGARLLGAYDRHLPGAGGMGFRQLPHETEAELRRHAEARLRAVLAPGAYARAHAEGGGLTVPEAAALAERHGG